MPIDVSQVIAFSAELRNARGQVGAKAAAVIRKTALDIESTAKGLAPVDTGNLRNSISTTVTGSGSFGSMSAEIGPTASYGAYVEFGTSRMAPQPYMNPAASAHEGAFAAAMEAVAAELLGG